MPTSPLNETSGSSPVAPAPAEATADDPDFESSSSPSPSRHHRRLRRRRRRWFPRRGGGGGFRGGGGGGGGGMPPQVVGEGKGVVKFFDPQKGFGFIVRDDGGEDVFVHISAVEQAGLTDLADGQPLEFTLVDRGGRMSATNLQIDGEPMAVRNSGAGGAAPRERKLTARRLRASSSSSTR